MIIKQKMIYNILALLVGLFLLNSCEEKSENQSSELSPCDGNTLVMLQDHQHCNMFLAKFILEKWIIDGKPPALKTVLSYMKEEEDKMKNEGNHIPIFINYDSRYQLLYNKSNFLLLSHPQQYGEMPYVNKSIKANDVIYSVVFIPLEMLYQHEIQIKKELDSGEDDRISLETYKYLTKYVKEKKKGELLHEFQTNLSKFRKIWKESKSLVGLPDDDSRFSSVYMQDVTLKDIMDVVAQNRKQVMDILNNNPSEVLEDSKTVEH